VPDVLARPRRIAALVLIGGLSLGSAPEALAQGCFLRSQQQFGTTRTCIYDCFGREMRTTVPANRICPLTTGEPAAPADGGGAGGVTAPPTIGEPGAASGSPSGATPPTSLGQPPTALPTLPQPQMPQPQVPRQ
jgi:hypothetical protein